ncbi:MAG TPA: hypothetical protein VEF06_11395 [Bryobacteraceae bacterium]|nr:hypothetical protein [Bryobacteraceae bacterium]
MKKTIAVGLLWAAVLMAQGPGGGRGFGGGFSAGRGFGPGGGFGGFGPQKVVTGAPYSATETSTSVRTLANGSQITNTSQATVARDSQGRVSTSRTVTPAASSGKAPYTVTTIFDPVAGYSYSLNSSTMIATQIALPQKKTTTGTRPAPPSNPNVTTTSLGTQTINGVSATGTEVTRTIPAGTIGNAQAITATRVTWVSTALQIPVEIKSNDPMFGTTDMEVTNIVQAEPNASLFLVPAGYTIQTPSAGRKGAGMRQPGGHARQF